MSIYSVIKIKATVQISLQDIPEKNRTAPLNFSTFFFFFVLDGWAKNQPPADVSVVVKVKNICQLSPYCRGFHTTQ